MDTTDHAPNLTDTTHSKPKDIAERDPKVPGLMLRHRSTRSSWHLYYRTKDGRERRPKIGDARVLTRTQARAIALKWLGIVANGGDPSADAGPQHTIRDLGARFLKEHLPKRKPKTGEMYRHAWRYIEEELGSLRVASITRADVAALHHKMRDKPGMANRVMAVMRKALNLAEVWGWRPIRSNPVHGIDFYPERKRRRYPSIEEAVRLIRTMDEFYDQIFVGYVWLLTLTGCRPTEILTAERAWVKPDGLHLPDSKTGERIVALPEPARAVISALPVIQGNPYLIPGRRAGRPLVGVGKKWRRLIAEAKIENLQMRDLRRYFASLGLSADLPLETIGQLLGHTQAQTTKVYAYLMVDARTRAAEATAAELAKVAREARSLPS